MPGKVSREIERRVGTNGAKLRSERETELTRQWIRACAELRRVEQGRFDCFLRTGELVPREALEALWRQVCEIEAEWRAEGAAVKRRRRVRRWRMS